MNKKEDQLKTATTIPQQLNQLYDKFTNFQIKNNHSQGLYIQSFSSNSQQKYQKTKNQTTQPLQTSQQQQKSIQYNNIGKLHHDHFRITQQRICPIQKQGKLNKIQQNIMNKVLEDNQRRNRSIKKVKKNEFYQPQLMGEDLQNKRLSQVQLFKGQIKIAQTKKTLFKQKQANDILFQNLKQKYRLIQTLKNIHIFYGIRIQQIKQRNVQNGFLLINLLHQTQNEHKTKAFLLKISIEKQKNKKLMISQSQKQLSNLSFSMQKAIQTSIQQKQKNQSLIQKLKLKQISIHKKQHILSKLKKELSEKQQTFENIKKQEKLMNTINKRIQVLLSKQYIQTKIPQFQQ